MYSRATVSASLWEHFVEDGTLVVSIAKTSVDVDSHPVDDVNRAPMPVAPPTLMGRRAAGAASALLPPVPKPSPWGRCCFSSCIAGRATTAGSPDRSGIPNDVLHVELEFYILGPSNHQKRLKTLVVWESVFIFCIFSYFQSLLASFS